MLKRDGSVLAWGSEYPADELGPDARLDIGATKLGRRPDLRARSRWPTRDGAPLSFVAQIDLARVAPRPRPPTSTHGAAVVLLSLLLLPEAVATLGLRA